MQGVNYDGAIMLFELVFISGFARLDMGLGGLYFMEGIKCF